MRDEMVGRHEHVPGLARPAAPERGRRGEPGGGAARGSLDVLLSTPMSTRSILAGKWWGSFRRVLGVAIWPAATSLFLAYDRGYWVGFGLLLGLVLAYGAAITSLGLAAGDVGAPAGPGVALCVTTYVVFSSAGRSWSCSSRGTGRESTITAMMMGDPPVGTFFGTLATSAIELPRPAASCPTGRPATSGCSPGSWSMSPSRRVLFLATLATFDRCLGRIPDDGTSPPSRRPTRSSLTHRRAAGHGAYGPRRVRGRARIRIHRESDDH